MNEMKEIKCLTKGIASNVPYSFNNIASQLNSKTRNTDKKTGTKAGRWTGTNVRRLENEKKVPTDQSCHQKTEISNSDRKQCSIEI